jgi:hypothetical protein
MEFIKKHFEKHLVKYIVSVVTIGVFVIVFLIPVAINWIYKTPASNELMKMDWNADTALMFYGSVLTLIGTMALAAVALFQNKNAHNLNKQLLSLNKQLLKLQEAQFVSVISVQELMISIREASQQDSKNPQMPIDSNIDMTMESFQSHSKHSYHIDVKFCNSSNYPIIQLRAHAGDKHNEAQALYGIKKVDKAINIPAKGEANIRFIVPNKIFAMSGEYELQLHIWFINIFDYQTKAKLRIESLHIDSVDTEFHHPPYKFRLAKFTDVRPENETTGK